MAQKWALAQVAYEGKIRTFARNSFFVVPGFSVEDMEQEALIILWKCVNAYNPDHGATFNTFFWQCARNFVSDQIRRHTAIKRQAEWYSLSDEEVAAAVEIIMQHQPDSLSAEDRMMLRLLVAEAIESNPVSWEQAWRAHSA